MLSSSSEGCNAAYLGRKVGPATTAIAAPKSVISSGETTDSKSPFALNQDSTLKMNIEHTVNPPTTIN